MFKVLYTQKLERLLHLNGWFTRSIGSLSFTPGHLWPNRFESLWTGVFCIQHQRSNLQINWKSSAPSFGVYLASQISTRIKCWGKIHKIEHHMSMVKILNMSGQSYARASCLRVKIIFLSADQSGHELINSPVPKMLKWLERSALRGKSLSSWQTGTLQSAESLNNGGARGECSDTAISVLWFVLLSEIDGITMIEICTEGFCQRSMLFFCFLGNFAMEYNENIQNRSPSLMMGNPNVRKESKT